MMNKPNPIPQPTPDRRGPTWDTVTSVVAALWFFSFVAALAWLAVLAAIAFVKVYL